jgi:hypothetical protein
MAHAYTPGLTVSPYTTVTKRRILPLKGDVVVAVGDSVQPDTVVARTALPGKVLSKNVSADLGLPPSDIVAAMNKKEGDSVTKDEVVAEQKSFFGVFKSRSLAPVTGTIETISAITGQVLYREPPVPVEVKAYVRGTVKEVIPREGVMIEARGAFIQGIFGIGGEAHGPIMMAAKSPDEILTASALKPEYAGKIIVGGKLVTLEAVREAAKLGVRGIVVGGLNDDDLRAILGFDLGVAITGHEKLGLSLVITEGFGEIAIAKKTFELLAAHEEQEASIHGATQIRAGVIRPEVIIPIPAPPAGADSALGRASGMMEIGSAVRIIREPHFGVIGTVASLPAELTPLETEAKVRVLGVQIKGGALVTLPRANVELIEG